MYEVLKIWDRTPEKGGTMEEQKAEWLGFCYHCNKPVWSLEGFYLNPNPMGNAYDTAKPVHARCHYGNDGKNRRVGVSDRRKDEMPIAIGPGDPL